MQKNKLFAILKILTIFVYSAFAILIKAAPSAAQTSMDPSNSLWYFNMNFYIQSTTKNASSDTSKLTFGLVPESAGVHSVRKPPMAPLDGADNHSVVHAYIDTAKGAMQTDYKRHFDTSVRSHAWIVRVFVEQANKDVYVSIDYENTFPEYSHISIIDPETGDRRIHAYTKNTECTAASCPWGFAFNSGPNNHTTKTLIVMAGQSQSYLVSKGGASPVVRGRIYYGGTIEKEGFAVYVDDAQYSFATPPKPGDLFTIIGLSGGDHVIQGTTPCDDGSSEEKYKGCTLPASGRIYLSTQEGAYTATALNDLLVGDVNGDCTINITDLVLLKPCFGKSKREPGFLTECDFNKDEIVDITDFIILKKGFGVDGFRCK